MSQRLPLAHPSPDISPSSLHDTPLESSHKPPVAMRRRFSGNEQIVLPPRMASRVSSTDIEDVPQAKHPSLPRSLWRGSSIMGPMSKPHIKPGRGSAPFCHKGLVCGLALRLYPPRGGGNAQHLLTLNCQLRQNCYLMRKPRSSCYCQESRKRSSIQQK